MIISIYNMKTTVPPQTKIWTRGIDILELERLNMRLNPHLTV